MHENDTIPDPEILDKKFERKRRKYEFRSELIPEMEILEKLSKSTKHKHLLSHPVIKSLIYFKWKKISPVYEKCLKFNLLFVYCITWYIFNVFGGLELNSRKADCTRGVGFDCIIRDNAEMIKFCNKSDNKKILKDGQERDKYYELYSLKGFAEEEDFNKTLFNPFSAHEKLIGNCLNDRPSSTHPECNYNNDW